MIEGPILYRTDGSYVIQLNWHPYQATKDYCPDIFSEVEAYLVVHPEALIPEPLPPEPSAEHKKAMKDIEDEAKEWELDKAWIRAQRKKG